MVLWGEDFQLSLVLLCGSTREGAEGIVQEPLEWLDGSQWLLKAESSLE